MPWLDTIGHWSNLFRSFETIIVVFKQNTNRLRNISCHFYILVIYLPQIIFSHNESKWITMTSLWYDSVSGVDQAGGIYSLQRLMKITYDNFDSSIYQDISEHYKCNRQERTWNLMKSFFATNHMVQSELYLAYWKRVSTRIQIIVYSSISHQRYSWNYRPAIDNNMRLG